MDYDMALIECVRQHPELYDNTHHNFKNKEVKYELWTQIAYQLRQESDGQAVRLVKMRWKSLRDSYVKETKHKNALNNGSDIKPKKHWRYFEAMSFLTPFLSLPNAAKGVRYKRVAQHPDYIEEVEPVENFFITTEDLKEVSEDSYNEHDPTLSEWLDHPTDKQFVTSPNDYQENDIDSFFKGIADTVKRLKPVNQIKIQRDIVNMVLDVKLKEVQENKDPLDA